MATYYAFDAATNEVILGNTGDLSEFNKEASEHSSRRKGHNIVVVQAVASWLDGARADALTPAHSIAVMAPARVPAPVVAPLGPPPVPMPEGLSTLMKLVTSSPPATATPPAATKAKVGDEEVDLKDVLIPDDDDEEGE